MKLRIAGLLVMGFAGVAAFGQTGRLLVVEKVAKGLGIVDAATGKQVAVVSEAVPEAKISGKDTGHEVAASADGKYAFVPIYGDSGVGRPGTDGQTMVAVDLAAQKVVGTLDFGHGVRPHCAVFNPHDGLVYVTTELDKAITIVDVKNPAAMRIVGQIPTGAAESHMLVISHDGRWGYTANVGPGSVSVLDIKARKLVTVIPLVTEELRPGHADKVQRIAVSVDDKWVFTSDQQTARLAVIDATTRKVAKWIPMSSFGYGAAATPDGRWLLVALNGAGKVAVVDLKSMAVAQEIAVPRAPQEVVVRPDGKVAYVSCDASGVVVELDLAGWKVARTIETGKVSDGLAWAH